jgi:hypothetical protein
MCKRFHKLHMLIQHLTNIYDISMNVRYAHFNKVLYRYVQQKVWLLLHWLGRRWNLCVFAIKFNNLITPKQSF